MKAMSKYNNDLKQRITIFSEFLVCKWDTQQSSSKNVYFPKLTKRKKKHDKNADTSGGVTSYCLLRHEVYFWIGTVRFPETLSFPVKSEKGESRAHFIFKLGSFIYVLELGQFVLVFSLCFGNSWTVRCGPTFFFRCTTLFAYLLLLKRKFGCLKCAIRPHIRNRYS